MDIRQALVRVQSAYPRIYLSCHTRHQNSRTTPDKLSQRDGAILAHLDEHQPVTQGTLARHMGLAKSTLSEALCSLEDTGYLARAAHGKELLIRRTLHGTRAMSRGSVLESARLRRLLRALTETERRAAVAGIELLAAATERIQRNAR